MLPEHKSSSELARLTRFSAKALRGTAGHIAIIASGDTADFIGIFMPTLPHVIASNLRAQAILHWALSHPATKELSGLLQLDRDTFAHLDGHGAFSIYILAQEGSA